MKEKGEWKRFRQVVVAQRMECSAGALCLPADSIIQVFPKNVFHKFAGAGYQNPQKRLYPENGGNGHFLWFLREKSKRYQPKASCGPGQRTKNGQRFTHAKFIFSCGVLHGKQDFH